VENATSSGFVRVKPLSDEGAGTASSAAVAVVGLRTGGPAGLGPADFMLLTGSIKACVVAEVRQGSGSSTSSSIATPTPSCIVPTLLPSCNASVAILLGCVHRVRQPFLAVADLISWGNCTFAARILNCVRTGAVRRFHRTACHYRVKV
jgi:hypothetical protein